MRNLVVAIVVLGAIGSAVTFGYCKWQHKHDVKAAQAAFEKGYNTLASEVLEHHRKWMTKSADDCKLLVNIYYSARNPGALAWAAESCLTNGIDLPETNMALAFSRDMGGRTQEAVQILGSVVDKYKDIPDVFYRMAQMLVRLGNNDAAAVAYSQALERAKDNAAMFVEALDFMATQKMWDAAKPIAMKIKDTEIDNPAIKLLIARVLVNSGERESAKPLIASSKTLLEKSPNRAQIEKAFADILR